MCIRDYYAKQSCHSASYRKKTTLQKTAMRLALTTECSSNGNARNLWWNTSTAEAIQSHNGRQAFESRSKGSLILIARGLEASSSGCGDGVGGSGARRLRTSEMCAQAPLLEVAPHVRLLCIRTAAPLCRRVWLIYSSCCCRRVCVRAASAGGPFVAAPEALDGGAQQIIPPKAVEVRAVVREERVRVARRRRRGRALAASGEGESASNQRRALL